MILRYRAAALSVLLALAACGGVVAPGSDQSSTGDNSPGTPAPTATTPVPAPTPSTPNPQPASPFCQTTLASACATGIDCPKTVGSIPLASWCTEGQRVYSSSCAGETEIVVAGVDTATDYYFDSSGNLVAIVGNGNIGTECIGGPPSFAPLDCLSPSSSDLCQDGG